MARRKSKAELLSTESHLARLEVWLHPALYETGREWIKMRPNPILVAGRLLDCHTEIRPIVEFSGGGGPLEEAIRNGTWKIALQDGQCLIYRCQEIIPRGSLFLLNPDGFGYCINCLIAIYKDRHIKPPTRPEWAKILARRKAR